MKMLEGIPIKLVCIILFLYLSELCIAQGLGQFLSRINREEENPLPDDDIILLEYIEHSFSELNPSIIEHIERLTFLEEIDISLLKSTKEFQLIPRNKLSENGELFIDFLNTLNKKQIPVDIYFKQYFTAKNDLQFRWTGRINQGNKEFGFLAERDPFETRALDQISMYMEIKTNYGNIFLGDHQINNGYGLLLWRSVPVKKGIGSFNQLSRIGKGLQIYKSSHENWKIRGVGSQIYTKLGQITVSIGQTNRDGEIDSTGNLKVYDSGIHVSETELNRQESLSEKSIIMNWEKEIKDGVFGFTTLSASWTEKKRVLRALGNSLYFNKKIDVLNIFGEIANGNNKTMASLMGVKTNFKMFKYLGIVRKIAPGYKSLRSNPSTEWLSTSEGENGFFQSILFKIDKHRFTLYTDLFRKIRSSTLGIYPESGIESGAQYEKRGKNSIIRLRLKQENKTLTSTKFITDELNTTNSTTRYQITGYYTHSGNFKSKLQLNVTEANEAIGYGVNYRLDKQISHMNYTIDWISSNVNSFDTRIYFWDINLPGEMRSKMVSYMGHNLGIRMSYKADHYRLSFRISSTWKDSLFMIKPEVTSGLLLESYY